MLEQPGARSPSVQRGSTSQRQIPVAAPSDPGRSGHGEAVAVAVTSRGTGVSSRQAVRAAKAEPTPQYRRLRHRSYWLVRLRWLAALGTCLGAWVTGDLLGLIDQDGPLYVIAGLLVLENMTAMAWLKRVDRLSWREAVPHYDRVIHFQICADLILLTVLLHFTGGVENPLMVAFVFHMVIASILLPARESYLQATLAVFLMVFLVVLEWQGWIAHHCLRGLLTAGFHEDGWYVLASLGVLAATLYLVVYMTTDISTRLRRQEEAYRQANIQLLEKDCVKDEYVGRVTHDIKGHLAAIQSCHDVVVSGLVGVLNDKQRDLIGRAHRRTAQLTRFVKTLLALTERRLSNHLPMEAFGLADVIQGAVAAAQTKAEEKSIRLQAASVPSDVDVVGHALSIEETITNLLLNAVKYTPSGGQVELTTDVGEQEVTLEIRDTGIGIPAEDLPHVFEEFYRAKNARCVERDGTGLGLALAQQIIERHGGRIWIRSQENHGTTVGFSLWRYTQADRRMLSVDPSEETL